MIYPNSLEELATYVEKGKMFSSLLLIGAETVVSLNQSCLKLKKHFQRFNLSKSTVISLLTWLPSGIFWYSEFCRN